MCPFKSLPLLETFKAWLQVNALRQDQAARRVVKRSRWLLLRNRDNLSDEHTVKLDELLAANAPLSTVYVLKTQLKELWYASNTDTAHYSGSSGTTWL